MNKIISIMSLFFLSGFLTFCTQKKNVNEEDVYEFLNICFENYYDTYDVDIKEELHQFEGYLIANKYLKDEKGSSYKLLLHQLNEENYFQPSTTKKEFNPIVLSKNPSNIMACAEEIYGIDSTEIMSLSFSKLSLEIRENIEKNEEISIHYFFEIYHDKLSPEEIEKPYVKESILLLLYRWYYISLQKNKEVFG